MWVRIFSFDIGSDDGFPAGQMPQNFDGLLTEQDMDDLVAFLLTLLHPGQDEASLGSGAVVKTSGRGSAVNAY